MGVNISLVPLYTSLDVLGPADSLEALEKHKQEPLHQEATKKERKISRCTLCKKQFTSPPQLQVKTCETMLRSLWSPVVQMIAVVIRPLVHMNTVHWWNSFDPVVGCRSTRALATRVGSTVAGGRVRRPIRPLRAMRRLP